MAAERVWQRCLELEFKQRRQARDAKLLLSNMAAHGRIGNYIVCGTFYMLILVIIIVIGNLRS